MKKLLKKSIVPMIGFIAFFFFSAGELQARMYDPGQGRFVSRDPVGQVDGPNLYRGYFGERFGVDPSGLRRGGPFPWDWGDFEPYPDELGDCDNDSHLWKKVLGDYVVEDCTIYMPCGITYGQRLVSGEKTCWRKYTCRKKKKTGYSNTIGNWVYYWDRNWWRTCGDCVTTSTVS